MSFQQSEDIQLIKLSQKKEKQLIFEKLESENI